MEPIRFKCAKCGSKLRAKPEEAGTTSACPKCGNIIKIPFGGLKIGSYWAWKIFKYTGFIILGAAMGDGSFLLIPFTLGTSVYLAYLRAINIGNPGWYGVWGLIPGSIFYFGLTKEGAAKKKPQKVNLTSLSEKQKSFLRAHLEGASIEWAAVQNEIKINTAMKIYGEFYAAYSKLPKAEQAAYIETTLA
jgi:DNA-directed RNA polymerase subunit RPC12/RpoP